MRIKFWGVRGSIPSPVTSAEIKGKLIAALVQAQGVNLGDRLAVEEYVSSLPPLIQGTVGGNTPCVSIQVGDEWIILDAGSGLRALGDELMTREFGRGQGVAHIFISHTHWDHIQGFPFFRPAHTLGNRITIYSPVPNLEQRFQGQQVPEYFPISLGQLMRADVTFVKLQENVPVTVAGIQVNNILQAHPGRSYGYRLDGMGASIVYATDAEYKNLGEAHTQRYVDFMTGADLLIYDAQYTLSDSLQHVDWGHSSSMIGVDMAVRASVKRLVLFHFEPAYSDKRVQEILDNTLKYIASDPAQPKCDIYLATEGLEFELGRREQTTLKQRPVGDTLVLSISGRFDASAVNQVDERLTALISDGLQAGVVIDLSEMTHLSVAGLKTLINAQQMGQGIPLVLAAAPANVQEVLTQAGFAEAFDQYDTVEEAVSALEARRYLQLQGQMLHGRYNVKSMLDISHKAAVFKALDTWFERPVVIKALSKSLGEQVDELLLHEARAVARLNHPNIVSVYDCVEYQDHLYLIREYIEGHTLRGWLHELNPGERLPPVKVLDIATGVVQGLAYAHQRQILHRRLQPKNIILSDHEVKIMNFGLQDSPGQERSKKEIIYTAPEYLARQEFTAASDLYSFGMILYELTTGQLPFSDPAQDLLQQCLHAIPPPPHELGISLPSSLEDTIMILLKKDPRERTLSAQEVLQTLASISPWSESSP
jgi:anti-anti-sigma factor